MARTILSMISTAPWVAVLSPITQASCSARRSASLERHARPEADHHDAGDALEVSTHSNTDAAAGGATHHVPVRAKPGHHHYVIASHHQQETDQGVVRLGELGHHAHEDGAGLGIQEIVE